MAHQAELNRFEAALVSYIMICMRGRAARLHGKRKLYGEREALILNEPWHEDESSAEERVDRLVCPNELPLDEQVANRLTLQQAISELTETEAKVIRELFWNQKQAVELSEELEVSVRAIHKTKRRALDKLRARLEVQA